MYMETDMELSKKTTILLTHQLHEQLSRLAAQKGVSLGELVRDACRKQYGVVSEDARIAAVRDIEALSLPVADPGEMKEESVPRPGDLMP